MESQSELFAAAAHYSTREGSLILDLVGKLIGRCRCFCIVGVMSEEAKEKDRILILCVDRDDDLGVKAGVKTPVIGREENLNAATQLAIKDPEEADANAIFEAIRLYDTMASRSKDEEYEVATIAGSYLGDVDADKKLLKELNDVLPRFKASHIILISDGFADEAVIPIIQSKAPILSVRRVIVRHSESIEETAALFSRYLKLLVKDPRYSRIFLGVPGLLILTFGLLWILGYLYQAGLATMILLGFILLVKGFGIDEKVRSIAIPGPPGFVKLFTRLAGVILFGVGLYRAHYFVLPQVPQGPPPWTDPAYWLSLLPFLTGLFLESSIDMMILGICVWLIGKVIYLFLNKDVKMWHNIIGVVVCVPIRFVALQASQILIRPETDVWPLIITTGLGIIVSLVAILITFILSRKATPYFTKEK